MKLVSFTVCSISVLSPEGSLEQHFFVSFLCFIFPSLSFSRKTSNTDEDISYLTQHLYTLKLQHMKRKRDLGSLSATTSNR